MFSSSGQSPFSSGKSYTLINIHLGPPNILSKYKNVAVRQIAATVPGIKIPGSIKNGSVIICSILNKV